MAIPRPFIVALLSVLTVAHRAECGPYTEQLKRECDDLLQCAIRRPYGWAWDSAVGPQDARTMHKPRQVSYRGVDTPSAGLLLLHAGLLLEQRGYVDAAREVARGICASQKASGQIPRRRTFAAAPGGRDEPELVPARDPTVASIAFFCEIMRLDPRSPDPVGPHLTRAISWLLAQQTEAGGFPSLHPFDTTDRNSRRLVRLDEPDFRNCVASILLAGLLTGDRRVLEAADRSSRHVAQMRLAARNATRYLWPSAANLDGSPAFEAEGVLSDADLLASRLSAQILLMHYLVRPARDTGLQLEESCRTIQANRIEPEKWARYPLSAATRPSDADVGIIGDWGLTTLLETVSQLRLMGADRYLAMLRRNRPIETQLAFCAAGLTDELARCDWPSTRAEVAPFIERNRHRWTILDGPIPAELASRNRRIELLLLLARLEQLAQR
jgi:hypothetical protein